jgi:hypothetical protein
MRSVAFDRLLESSEPSVRFKLRVDVLGEDPESDGIRALRREIRRSPRVCTLLEGATHRDRSREAPPAYQKWQGAHWVLVALAELGFPPGDASLRPLVSCVLDTWLAPKFFDEFESPSKAHSYAHAGVPVMEGRHRRCASQQGNALYALVRLGFVDARTERLAERLLHWQWPDGGWNCDRNPGADTSSFMETLAPLRGLAAFAGHSGDRDVARAVRRAADVFLTRDLYRRRTNGALIRREFTELHYPLYWHYDILGGLKVLAEAGLIRARGCQRALDLLESKRLPDGSFPAERRYYRVSSQRQLGTERVDWGGTSRRSGNPWVTADALAVLRAARRPL